MSQPIRRFSFALLLLLVSLLIQAGTARADWKSEWQSTLAAARKEGTVKVHGPPGTKYIDAIDSFRESYPKIKLINVPGTGGQHSSRLGAERRAGKFLGDVFIDGSGTGGLMYKAGTFDTLPLIIPENTDQSLWFSKKHLYADPEHSHLIIMQGNVTSTIAAYNTKKLRPGELKSFADLLNPKWRGKMVAFDPVARGQLQTWKGIYHNKNLGPKFIQRLFSEMDVTIGRDQRLMLDWVAKGRYSLYIAARSTEVADAKRQGLPVDVFRAPTDEGHISGGWGHIALINRAPHPNAARVFINWMLSKEGQLAWQNKTDNNSLPDSSDEKSCS